MRGLRALGDVRIAGLRHGRFRLGELSFVSSNLPLVAVGVAVAGFGVSWLIVG